VVASTVSVVEDLTLEALFSAAVIERVAPGAGDAVQRVAADYIERATVFNGRGRALQLYPVALRVWTSWVAAGLAGVGLPDLAAVVRREGIVDADSAFIASELAPEYVAQVMDLPPSSLPGVEEVRAAVVVAIREAQALLAILGETPPYLGEVEPAQFAVAVRHAASALVALSGTALVELPTEVAHVLGGTGVAGPVKLPV
jgi:hypothetical protein